MPNGWRWPSTCSSIRRSMRLLDGPTRFEDMPAAMPRILAPGGLCHVITYGTD